MKKIVIETTVGEIKRTIRECMLEKRGITLESAYRHFKRGEVAKAEQQAKLLREAASKEDIALHIEKKPAKYSRLYL
jgi:exonuclease VII small subunit